MGGRLQVLELIESGQIDVEEGVRRLEALAETGEAAEAPGPAAAPVVRPRLARVLWQAMLWFGVLLAGGGGLLVVGVYGWGFAARSLCSATSQEGGG